MTFEADQDLEGGPRLISDAFVSEPLIGRDIYIYPIKSTVSYRHIAPRPIGRRRRYFAGSFGHTRQRKSVTKSTF